VPPELRAFGGTSRIIECLTDFLPERMSLADLGSGCRGRDFFRGDEI
jgi:hypothetical protein